MKTIIRKPFCNWLFWRILNLSDQNRSNGLTIFEDWIKVVKSNFRKVNRYIHKIKRKMKKSIRKSGKKNQIKKKIT